MNLKTFTHKDLHDLYPCSQGRNWADTQATMSDVWDNCPKGQWLWWLLRKISPPTKEQCVAWANDSAKQAKTYAAAASDAAYSAASNAASDAAYAAAYAAANAAVDAKQVRKQLHSGEWWFAISDVIGALTDSDNPSQYLRNLRNRDEELSELFEPVEKGVVQIEPPLALLFDTPGGKQKLLAWNTEGVFRLIQSIPSKKAEPFKRWLARVGYERVQEIENPELAQKRMKMLYRLKG